jgi:integrase/recombinase XerD
LAGLTGVHPHMLRRTYGQIRRAAGVSIEVVSRDYGHANINTTMRYTTPQEDDWDVISQDYI